MYTAHAVESELFFQGYKHRENYKVGGLVTCRYSSITCKQSKSNNNNTKLSLIDHHP